MTNRFRLTFAALVAAAALLAAGPAGPASAQEGEGEIELEAVHPAGQSLHFIVRVTEGGDPANDASVTAAAVSVSGESLSPVDLTRDDDDGRYSGPVEFPSAGLWTVRFTSTNPDATLEVDQEVELSPSTTAGSGDNQVTVGTEGTGGEFAPEDDGTGDSAQAADDGEDTGLPIWLIVLAAVVVIGGVLAALALRSRPPASPGDGTGGEGGDESEPEPAAGPPGSGAP
jgi:hypothetical protein